MANNKIIGYNTMVEFANAIREKTKTSSKFSVPVGMVDAISNIDSNSELMYQRETIYEINKYFYPGSVIGTYAFSGYPSIQKVDLPDCTSVGYRAFMNCRYLSIISLPKCTNIGSGAFSYCNLQSIVLPKFSKINEEVFRDNSNMFSNLYDILDSSYSIYDIGSRAFENTAVEAIPSSIGLSIVNQYTFAGCSNLSYANLNITKELQSGAFANCSNLISISLPICEKIGDNAFWQLNLTSIDLPKCKYIGDSAFESCLKIISYNLPICSYIGANAFNNNTNLTSLTLPECVTIGSCAFSNCIHLSNLSIPKVETLESWAFFSCSLITEISIPNIKSLASNALSKYYDPSSYVSIQNPDLLFSQLEYIGGNIFTSYVYPTAGTTGTLNLPKCTYLGESNFSNCNYTSIFLPECSYIGSITGLTNLKTLTIPKCTSIYYNAFIDSPLEGEFVFSSYNSDTFNWYALSGKNITKFEIHNVNTVYTVFTNCSYLSEVIMPDTQYLSYFDSNTFKNCSQLSKVELQSLLEVPSGCFYNCTKLSNIVLNNASILCYGAFLGCTNLTSISLPNVQNLQGSDIFKGCHNLKEINLPQLSTIQNSYIFYNCSALETLSLPRISNIIDSQIAANCPQLTTLYIGTEINYICSISKDITNLFISCPNITSVYVPSVLLDLYQNNSYWSYWSDKFIGI